MCKENVNSVNIRISNYFKTKCCVVGGYKLHGWLLVYIISFYKQLLQEQERVSQSPRPTIYIQGLNKIFIQKIRLKFVPFCMLVRVLAVVEANYKQMHPLLVSFVLILACISEKSRN